MYILVGGAGYIGRNIISQLETRGLEYRCLDVLNEVSENDINFDMRNPSEGLVEIERHVTNSTIILLAAASSNEVVRADPQKALETNTTHLLETVKEIVKYKPSQIIFASSEWVYASDEHGKLIDDFSRNTSAYGRQKIAGEIIVRDICENHGLPYFIARFGIVWGNRRGGSAVESIIQKVFESPSSDGVLTVGHAESARRFIHIEDLVYGLLKVSARMSGTYDMTGSEVINILNIVNSAGEVLGKRLKTLSENPDPSIRLLSSSDIKQPDFTIVRDSFSSRVEKHINRLYMS
jgi:nucleoside-diphosphate-sugar epimerase